MESNTPENQLLFSELFQGDPDTTFEILRDNWKNIKDRTGVKEMILNSCAAVVHPRVLDILHLGATDPSLQIQNYALFQVRQFALQDFSEDYSAYLDWRKQFAAKPIQEVLRENCRAYVARFTAADDGQRAQMAQELLSNYYNPSVKLYEERRQALVEAGLLDALEKRLAPRQATPGMVVMVRLLRPDETYLRRVIVPLIDRALPNDIRMAAIDALGRPENRWAFDLLAKKLLEEYPDTGCEMVVAALGQMADPRSIPMFIGMLESDNTPEGVRLLGGTLGQMTGVLTGATRNGAWWRGWWEKNRLRFAEDVRALPVPKLKLKPRTVAESGMMPVLAEPHRIGGDPQRAYWLLRPPKALPQGAAPQNKAAADAAPGLLVVLPGGDGNGGSVVTFWREVVQKALKGNYMVALPVAPKWNADPSIVWVTRGNRKLVKEAKFTVESFVADIVKDVAATQTLNGEHLFLHGAADSGPAVYACSLEETTPFRGFYILASTFKSAQLPPLSHARNRRYFLQHSKDDKVAPFWMAAAAQKLLSEQGAQVRLAAYRGNHGYDFADNLFDRMGEAITWLEGAK